jgi:hypothetical protein
MRVRSISTSILLLALLLTGCAGAASPDPTSTPPTATGASTPEAAPSSTSAPASAAELIVTLDTIEYRENGGTEIVALDQPGPLVALIEQLSGQPPAEEEIEDPWGNGDVFGTSFRWADVTIASLDQGPVTVTFLSPTVGDAEVKTAEGIGVGSTRAEVLAAGGWGEWDGDGDGAAELINLGMRTVPETTSLSRPGEVGAEFIGLSLNGDIVERMWSPSNDFSDL